MRPRLFTSLKSAAYFLLRTSYGGFGLYCELALSTNGVTAPHEGAAANGRPGMSWKSPGLVPAT